MRTYERTHKWLTFEIDLRKASAELWLLLGEAQSKCEHLAGIPLEPALQKKFNQVYIAKGARATTAIEGNTLSEKEVLALVKGEKLDMPASKDYLKREVANVIEAFNNIWDDDTGVMETLSVDLIKALNRKVLDGLPLEEGVEPGVIRRYTVGVGRYRAAPPEDCAYLLQRLCEWLGTVGREGPVSDTRMAIAVVKAVLAHLYLAWIHPFGDGNGRVARLVEFQILVHAGVPKPSAHLLSNHYNETRADYYRELDYASQSGGDVQRFLVYAVRGFVEGLRTQVEAVKRAQWATAWREFVHEKFAARSATETAKRQEMLVNALTEQSVPVPRAKIPMLSAGVAKAYAGRTAKTLSRDLNRLRKERLIRLYRRQGYRANTRLMLAFQPMRKVKEERRERQARAAIKAETLPTTQR